MMKIMSKRPIVMLFFIFMLLLINKAISFEVPCPPLCSSNEDWWMYQFDGYESDPTHTPYSNDNCGPSSAAMVINYLKHGGSNVVNTTYHAVISSSYPKVHCYSRWNYCQGNGHPNGYYNTDWPNDLGLPGSTTAQIIDALSSENIQTHTITGYDCINDGTGINNIKNAIDQGKVCICLVAPMYYRNDITTYFSHWTTVYGYDANNIYLNDPGYHTGRGYRATKSGFGDALWKVTELSTIIVIDTTLTTPKLPDPPVITSPGTASAPGSEITTLTPTFYWNAALNADKYGLYISKEPYGSSNIIFHSVNENFTITGTSFTLPSGRLQNGIKYRWNMQSYNSAGWGGVSNSLNFYVNIITPPDLIVDDIWVDPNPPNFGSPNNIWFRIKNQGNANAAGTFRSKLYFDGTYIAYADTNGLTTSSTATYYTNMSWPSDSNSHTIKVVVDADGAISESNDANNERTESFLVTTSSRTYYLSAGWNSISCPGNPVISNWSTITASNPNIALIVRYDPILKKFVFVTNIEFGKSYLIGVTNNTQFTLEYYPRSSLILPTKEGWNQLGSLSSSIPVSNITSDPSGKLALLVYWDNNTKRFENASTIQPGVGYLAGCLSDCTLSMSCSLLAPPNNQKIVTEPSWESILSVQTQSDHRELVFGMNRSASDETDLYDRPIPPFPDILGEINAGWLTEDSAFDLLETSFVKDNLEANWRLSVELMEDGEISWRNLPKAYSFTLLYDNGVVNMQTERSISLPIGKHILLISVKLNASIPDKTRLLANYPNPFNPETWIPYELSKDTKVKIMIYSLNGNLVCSLDLGYKPAGRYVEQSKAAYWDGRNESGERVSSGIYFYTLVTPEFSQIRKLVIMR